MSVDYNYIMSLWIDLIECFCCCRAIKRARNSFFVLLKDLAYQFRWSLVD